MIVEAGQRARPDNTLIVLADTTVPLIPGPVKDLVKTWYQQLPEEVRRGWSNHVAPSARTGSGSLSVEG
ncbi:hypothetical protein GCM10010347_43230 [Streptomyces cirratus]|uniref:Uncharacterized protein n=1 Tax=Streptomyces cirratus TaxID=68187 RepID=A0ABQ3EWC4_9ACTN|nr:hypothetical protein GCM10010347_43230 [Streptomyces cirratus]